MGLTPKGYKHRLVEDELKKQLRAFGGVSIEGPKWCSKTWLGLSASNSSFIVGDIDEYGQDNRELAKTNAHIAMKGEPPHLIDEWQEIPRLWDTVRSYIDRDSAKGRYVLTGSSTPKKDRPLHSGTGRIKRLRIRTMSLYESGDSEGSVSLNDIIMGKTPDMAAGGTNLKHIVVLIISGGWPSNLGMPYEDRASSVIGYLESMISMASNLDGIRRKESNLWMVMRSLARNECTLAPGTKIHNDTGIPLDGNTPLMLDRHIEAPAAPLSYDTVADYVNVFDRLFLIDNQPAFDPNLRSSVRVGRTVKRHLADPSLGIATLGIGKERLLKNLNACGFFFESMCERNLDIYSRSLGAKLFRYRDDSGMEVDSIVEMPDGRWGAFEIKLGAGRIDEAAENLLKFRSRM